MNRTFLSDQFGLGANQNTEKMFILIYIAFIVTS